MKIDGQTINRQYIYNVLSLLTIVWIVYRDTTTTAIAFSSMDELSIPWLVDENC